MKTLLFILLSLSATAQIGLVPKVIYKSTKADTITCGFSPVGSVQLKIVVDNDTKEDVIISGYHTLDLILDSGSVVVAQAKGQVAHTVYRNGINVTPALSADNSVADLNTFLTGLTIANYRKVVNKLLLKYLNKKEITQ